MSARYWVGGSDNWNGTAGTKWATTSGGTGGAAVPTSSDDVFFDANSGAVTVSFSGVGVNAANLDFTGFTGTLTGNGGLDIYGNLTLSASMTFTPTAGFDFLGSGTHSITPNGIAFTNNLRFQGSGTFNFTEGVTVTGGFFIIEGGSSVILGGNSTIQTLTLTEGTFDAGSYDLTINVRLVSTGTAARVLNLGSGEWDLTWLGQAWNIEDPTNMTLNAGTSTIRITGSLNADRIFTGSGFTYNVLSIENTGTASLVIEDDNTFNELSISPGCSVLFTAGSTQTVGTFDAVGTSVSPITLGSTTPSSQWSLSKTSGSVISQYLSLQDSEATGGATWLAVNSTDAGNNTGWSFVSTDLDPSTTYYVRAFAQNSAGYSYGNQESFTTLGGFDVAIGRRRLLMRR